MARWKPKPCGCVKADLPRSGRVSIRCARDERFLPDILREASTPAKEPS